MSARGTGSGIRSDDAWTPARLADLARLADEGLTLSELKRRFGVTLAELRRVCARAGVTTLGQRQAAPLSPDQVAVVRQMADEGQAAWQIAKALGVRVVRIHTLAARLGLRVARHAHVAWTAEADAHLRARWNKDSYAEIAGALTPLLGLRVSGNTVRARGVQLGLVPLVASGGAREVSVRRAEELRALARAGAPAKADPLALADDNSRPVLLVERRASQCARPLWPDNARLTADRQFVCGAPVRRPGEAWCADCRTRLYRRAGEDAETADAEAAA